ncbi:MAG: 2-dehydro-3-deoxy-6-phosphogalactonate aldolase [Rhodobacteraceae bacterium]|nr:2-dehydro-3-deoxy-6-phosphogalactonate aldolase [Paracoccaceae bacterium]
MRDIIAILRGVRPEEAISVADILLSCGISKLEIPLNSPEPFLSIERIIKTFSDYSFVGAGTVLDTNEVKMLSDIGASLIVSPDCNTDVIRETKRLSMVSVPGCFTPTECFQAIQSGADGLKIFPASLLGTAGLKALKSVLPTSTPLYVVGGVHAVNLPDWREAGASGFGVGASVFKPGDNLSDVKEKAERIVHAYDALN